MRRLLGVLALLAALAVAGCGGHSTSEPDPLTSALSFLPRNALFAAVVETDPGSDEVKGALDLVRQFPGAPIALARVEDELSGPGVTYRRDVEPLLGYPVAAAATGPHNGRYVVAGMAKDPAALRRVLAAAGRSGARQRGRRLGFTLYSAPREAFARAGTLVVAASDTPTLVAALERHARGRGLTPDVLDKARGDLPETALVSAYGNVARLLNRPGAARTQRMPFLAALKGYALTVRGSAAGLTLDARLDTSGGTIDPADLPLATGPDVPAVAALPSHITIGLRDPAQVVGFAEGVLRATRPARAERLRSAIAAIRSGTGIRLDRVVARQLTGDSTISVNPATRQVAARATLQNPRAAQAALARIAPTVPGLLTGAGVDGASVRRVAPGLWDVRRNGRVVGGYGVSNDELVAGSVSPAALAAFATQPTKVDPDGAGAVSIRVPHAIVARAAANAAGLPPAVSSLVLGRLGDLHGWVSNSTLGVRLSLRQDVR